MSEREMLERAAAAAGLKIHARWQAERDAAGHGDVGLWLANGNTCWNPLTDNRDALRLAVKLCMQVECSRGWQHVSVYGHDFTISEKHDGEDPYAATRLAITRAAAALAHTAQGE